MDNYRVYIYTNDGHQQLEKVVGLENALNTIKYFSQEGFVSLIGFEERKYSPKDVVKIVLVKEKF